jgi:hypothetical protein
VVGDREGDVLSAEEARRLVELATCVQEDDALRYVRSRIESWRDSYLASAKVECVMGDERVDDVCIGCASHNDRRYLS